MDLTKLSVSNGSGEAVRALVTVLRAPGGTVITPNSLVNWPTNFVATTGPLLADGTLDPAKTIVFLGHISGSTIVVDQLAPGYVDTYGSAVGDVVVIKPNTWWADTLVNAVTTNKNDIATINTTTFPLRQRESSLNYIASGGVITGDSYGATRNASMTAIICYINGYRQTVPAVTARAYTASKDTYVDVLYNASGVGTLVYTEVANNAASPALAADSIRVAIVVTGASNIANVGSINQGQNDKLLPIAGGFPYVINDSLGNRICRRNATETRRGFKLLNNGGAVIPSAYTTYISLPMITYGRSLEIDYAAALVDGNSGAVRSGHVRVLIDGAVVPDSDVAFYTPASGSRVMVGLSVTTTPAAGFHTIALQVLADYANATLLNQASLKVTEP